MMEYTDPPGMPEDERMTDAEFKVIREFLGLTGDWLADYLRVSPRTVRHWEQGKYPIPDGVRLTIEELEGTAVEQVSSGVVMLQDAPDPGIAIPRTEADCPPECPWPPPWHRAVAARIAQEIPGLVIVYADQALPSDGEPDIDPLRPSRRSR